MNANLFILLSLLPALVLMCTGAFEKRKLKWSNWLRAKQVSRGLLLVLSRAFVMLVVLDWLFAWLFPRITLPLVAIVLLLLVLAAVNHFVNLVALAAYDLVRKKK